MKILIVNNMSPFIWGGAEELAVNLEKNLLMAGHEAEILRIPFQWEPASKIPSQMLMVSALELINVDHVIALKFPAYLIPHSKKTLWLLHQYRQVYDLFDAGQSKALFDSEYAYVKDFIKNADQKTFEKCLNIFTNSEVTKNRLLKYNGFQSKVLLPPVNDPDLFYSESYGDYIFAGGRINAMKRQELLLKALSKSDQSVKLLIAGPPDSLKDAENLEKLVEFYSLQDRVKLDLRFLPRHVYADYLRKSLAVAYLPFDEDSLGYVAMEAATAGKAILTTTDSGGVCTIVKHHETGWIAEPTDQSLAEMMSLVFKNFATTQSYGRASKGYWDSFGIHWEKTVETLLS